MNSFPSYWYVNVSVKKIVEYVQDGVWQADIKNAQYQKYLQQMQIGDRIVAKISHSKKKDLPFEINNQHVGVMSIYAIGTLKSTLKENQSFDIEWGEVYEQPKEWYFLTYRDSINQIAPTDDLKKALIDFTFNGVAQDYQKFLQSPFWAIKYAQLAPEHRFSWIDFYKKFANKLLKFKNQRSLLLQQVIKIAQKYELNYILRNEQKDICPFTVMGMFNRSVNPITRTAIANDLAKIVELHESAPTIFDAIPLLNNQKSWFFGFEENRNVDDIDHLWEFFELAMDYADAGKPTDLKEKFIHLYQKVAAQYCIGWNLSMGLFWIRPTDFMTLDSLSQKYIKNQLNLTIPLKGPKRRCSGQDYVELLAQLEDIFQQEQSHVSSFPQLSLVAWQQEKDTLQSNDNDADLYNDSLSTLAIIQAEIEEMQFYNVAQIIEDGCFLEEEQLQCMLRRLKQKKNLILQGPTGTGKTWLAKRLGYALMGKKCRSHLQSVQFHPNSNYEDFIRGWRPALNSKTSQSELSLVDGPFLRLIEQAKQQPEEKFVLVIEEINRGNPAQIFGEMLTLLESSKRHIDEALTLSYAKVDELMYIPENIYVIGTMNIADRSLATLDLALRRRFAFIHLEPMFGQQWLQWCERMGLPRQILKDIEQRINALNEVIAADPSLGKQFCIGHSFLTPLEQQTIMDVDEWYCEIIETEIKPLLEEYWFDQPSKIKEQLEGLGI